MDINVVTGRDRTGLYCLRGLHLCIPFAHSLCSHTIPTHSHTFPHIPTQWIRRLDPVLRAALRGGRRGARLDVAVLGREALCCRGGWIDGRDVAVVCWLMRGPAYGNPAVCPLPTTLFAPSLQRTAPFFFKPLLSPLPYNAVCPLPSRPSGHRVCVVDQGRSDALLPRPPGDGEEGHAAECESSHRSGSRLRCC